LNTTKESRYVGKFYLREGNPASREKKKLSLMWERDTDLGQRIAAK